jgi:hypothetical protein
VCFSNLTVNTLLASSYGISVASGDVMETFASDNSGNVVAFVISNTDANGIPLASGGLYVTYIGLAGACSGISGTDVPFRKISRSAPRPMPRPLPRDPRHGPIRPLHTRNPRIIDALAHQRAMPGAIRDNR